MTDTTKKSLLLVEDEALIAMSEKLSLERYGYDVATVRSGEDAVEFFTTGGSADLILMDIDLGAGMDGTQAAQTILQDHDIPVVFLSSHTEPEIVEKTESITSYGYVVKSSSITVLDASIKMAFRLSDANRRLTDELIGRKRMEQALKESEEKFRALFEKGPIGVAYHRMEYDETGKAVDYLFLDANSSYLELTGVDPRGKRATEAFPEIEDAPFDWIGTFGQVARTGEPIRFQQYLRPNNRWYDCVGYQVKPDHFVAAFVEITQRKRFEEELTSQKQYLETILGTTSDGFWVVAPDKRITDVNAAYCRMTGYSRAELAAMTINDLDAVESPRETAERVRRIMHSGSETFETVHRRKDGSTFDMEVSASRIERPDGLSIVCFCRDITERKEIQQQILEKNAVLDEVLENMLDLVAITSMDGAFLYVGRSHERLGYSASSLIGRNVMDYVHPDDLGYVTQELASFVQSGDDRTVEYRYRCADGSYVWLESAGRLLNDENGTPSRILFNTRDITERKQNEERLHDVQAINRALFDQALGAVYIADMTGKFVDVNDGACRQSGYSREELLAMTVFDLNGPDADLREADDESLLDAWKRWVPGEQHIREATHVGKGGRRYPVMMSTGAIQLGNTKVVAGAVMDITERRHSEEQVRKLAADKETLIKEMQHRIKNNINTMTSLLSLQAQTLDEPTAIAALTDARNRLDSLGVLYDQLYAADARGEGSLLEYLQELVASEVAVFPHGNRVEVHSAIEDCSCATKTLSTLGLIVNELITNAMKYAFVDHPNPELTMTGVRDDKRYTLTIADNGPGRLEPEERKTSSGFGFMIVDALTEQLGGTIRFEDGGGTRAVLEFSVGQER